LTKTTGYHTDVTSSWSNNSDILVYLQTDESTQSRGFVIDYIDYIQYDEDADTEASGRAIGVNSPGSGYIQRDDDWDYFKLTPTTSGEYRIYSTGDPDLKGELYQGDYILDENDDISVEDSNWNFELSYYLVAGVTYDIAVSDAWINSSGQYYEVYVQKIN
jgi:hypothetical protein